MRKIYQFFVTSIRNRLLLVMFVVSLPALVAMVVYVGYFSRNLVIGSTIRSQKVRVTSQAQSVNSFLSGVREDVLFLSQLEAITRLLEADSTPSLDGVAYDAARETLEQEFLAFSEVKRIYYQVRFLDATGMEIARVDSDGQSSAIIAHTQLQNKVGRYYFDDTIVLPSGELMVSPLDLNVERGEIEVPHKPVIRYATPVWFDGEPAGIVIVNVFAERFLSPLKAMAEPDETIVLLDKAGYYLYHSTDEAKRWGRDLEKHTERLYVDYPETNTLFLVDKSIADSAALETADEYLFYERFSPPGVDAADAGASGDYFWVMVSIRSQRAVLATILQFEWAMLWALLLAIGVVVGLGLWMSANVVRPIRHLEQYALRLGKGDLDTSILTAPTLSGRVDEIGSLAMTLEQMREELQQTYVSLESQVVQVERRAMYLQTAAEVADSAVAILDPQKLLTDVVNLISTRFGFYHTGLFLLNEASPGVEGGEWAVLRSASSRGGERMLAREHRLRVGQQGVDAGSSMVGFVAATGQPRIALDVGEDAVHFINVDLPETRSEIALPLKVHDDVIGVLDVQSVEAAAFGEQDIVILQMLANQVAMMLYNDRLLHESQERYETLLRVQGEYNRQAWVEMSRALEGGGYRYSRQNFQDRKTLSSAQNFWQPTMTKAVVTKDIVHDMAQPETVALPLLLRDQVIGVIHARKPDGSVWREEEVSLLATVRGRLEVAMESARFYRESQQSAAREQLLREIAEQVRGAVDVDSVMRTAVQEIGRALGREVFVYVEDDWI